MRAITIELYPYFLIDVIYTISKRGVINVISGSINGINIRLTDEQRDALSEEILDIITIDDDENYDDDFIFSLKN